MFSDRAWRFRGCAGLLLACCLAAGQVAGHPELLAQIELINAELAERPGDTGLLLRRGDLYRRHGDYAAAAVDFDTVRKLDPTNDLLGFYAGRLWLQTGEAARAEASLTAYLECNPEHAAAWSLRGQARLARGLPLSAADDFNAAIAHSASTTPVLYLQHATALLAAGDDYWPLARSAADVGLEQHPYDMALLGLAADVALVTGQREAASEYLGRVPVKLMELPQWRSRSGSLGCLLHEQGNDPACAEPARERLEQRVRERSQAVRMDAD